MGTIISTSTSSGVTLSSTSSNPVTVTGTINATSGYGLYGKSGGGKNSWTVTNSGTIKSATNHGLDLGRQSSLVANGVITNSTGGYISGTGPIAYGVAVFGPGTLVNSSGATIKGQAGGVGFQGTGTVTNAGVILGKANGGGAGVYIFGGMVTNADNATISGQYGVIVHTTQAATVTNFGTITGSGPGSSGGAVRFQNNNAADRVIDNPGAVFNGGLYGGTGVLELASGASAGVLSGFGTTITNFSTLQFDSGSQWTVGGNKAGLGGLTSIIGFAAPDTIDLTGFVATSSTFSNNKLTLTNSTSQHAYLNIQGGFSASSFGVTNDGTNTFVALLCFRAGTRIATLAGEVPVEKLAIGDNVHAHFAAANVAPIRWTGRRHVDCARHPEPRKAWPVRVRTNAFGAGLPRRDLWLSPGHAVFVNDLLIPIRLLINGTSIAQVPVDDITYYHLELSQHDVLLAEGLPTESYLDVGDRANFEDANGSGAIVRLLPKFGDHSPGAATFWEAKGCAPLTLWGPGLEAVRDRLNGLAGNRSEDVPRAA